MTTGLGRLLALEQGLLSLPRSSQSEVQFVAGRSLALSGIETQDRELAQAGIEVMTGAFQDLKQQHAGAKFRAMVTEMDKHRLQSNLDRANREIRAVKAQIAQTQVQLAVTTIYAAAVSKLLEQKEQQLLSKQFPK